MIVWSGLPIEEPGGWRAGTAESAQLLLTNLSAKAGERRRQSFGLRRAGLMVRAGLFHGFRLGALGKGRVGEARGEAVAVFFRAFDGFLEASAFRVEVNRAFKREGDGGAASEDLRGIAGSA